jgi:hypothetical protein
LPFVKISRFAPALLSLSLGLAAVSVTELASAQPAAPSPDAVKKATDAFKEGTKLFQEKKFALALEQFRVSYDTVPSPNSHLYVARCQVEMGSTKEAFQTFQKVIAEAQERGKTEPKYLPTGESAKNELADLSKKLAVVTVTVANASETSRLRVGGALVAREDWGKPIPLDPGPLDVVLESQGAQPVKEHVELKAGDNKTLSLTAPDSGNAVPPPIEEPKPLDDGSGPGLLPIVFIAGGVGVIGMGMFAVGGGLSMGTESDLEAHCGPNGPCTSQEDKDLVDTGKTQQLVANIGLVVGAVGLATAATVLIIDLSTSGGGDAKPTDATAKMYVGPGSVGVRGSF